MNREQKRRFVKSQKKKGVPESEAKAYAEILSGGATNNSPRQDIAEDDKVKLNLELILARKNYENMNSKYKEFVNSNADTVFTAHKEADTLVSMKEEPQWLFWCGDLIKVDVENEKSETE